MQSSAMMALRALVLVVCLVAVPLFAIFGKDAPQVVRSLIENVAGASPRSVERNASNINEPPVFRPSALAASGSPVAVGSATHSDTVVAGSLAPLADVHAPGPTDPFQRTRNDQLAVRPASGATDSPQASAASAIHAHQTPPAQVRTNSEPNAHLQPLASSSFPPDYFRAAEQRLRELGATYYLLETLGPSGDNYRFYCKVAASEKPEQVFAFFATDHDPLEAINSVVRQVEGWRSHWMQ